MTLLLTQILASAAESMWRIEPTLGRYTNDTSQHELNLAFHYAIELRPWFSWLDCDFDVMKPNVDSDRPDIILHRRGTHALNYLVIEVKRAAYRKGVKPDLERIRLQWFAQPLNYRFGASVVLADNSPGSEVRLLERGNEGRQPTMPRSDLVIRNDGTDQDRTALHAIGDRIVAEKASYPAANTADLECELDRLVAQTYRFVPTRGV